MPLGKHRMKKCICPGCGKTHKLKLDWIGNGTPRKYCKKCFDRIQNTYYIEHETFLHLGSSELPEQENYTEEREFDYV